MLDDPAIRFHAADLARPIDHALTADLAISLEVAEHLPASRAKGFVSDLTGIAPAILFSAAVPGQGGVNHINERWQSYWAELFAAHGYRPYDLIRPEIWGDHAIPFWYRQNVLLYLSDAHHAADPSRAVRDLARLDLVHPELMSRANRELDYAGAMPESLYLAQVHPSRYPR
ncbi:hypothetical protein GCM10007989_20220 [Devosia pacifica]|uniref:Class I SAM-dependent methyltransferase n=2 Tax=Devosia pacifica TaxID=1335967 RepID=A0A918S568_9HYPH|nr:hypothetical protein GCM10007989_20220 [Devosia pacifica]